MYIAQLLEQVEEEFSCSGVCSNPGIFIFSNVNNGLPGDTCKEALSEKMEHGMNILLASNLTVTVITAITELVLFIIVGRRIFDCCCGKCVKRCKKCAEKR